MVENTNKLEYDCKSDGGCSDDRNIFDNPYFGKDNEHEQNDLDNLMFPKKEKEYFTLGVNAYEHEEKEEDFQQYINCYTAPCAIKREKIRETKEIYTQTISQELELDKEGTKIRKLNINDFKDEQERKIISQIFLNKKRKTVKNSGDDLKKQYNFGRKDKNHLGEGIHNKNAEDNIITKIKVYFINTCLIKWVNYTLNNEDKLLKIKYEITRQLKKDTNLLLMDKNLKEILAVETSSKLNKDAEYNKKLIKKFYENPNNYKLVISKLNLTFREVFEIFVTGVINEKIKEKICKDSKYNTKEFENRYKKFFLESFSNKEEFINEIMVKGGYKRNDDYIESICELCQNYENWFKGIYKKKTSENSELKSSED